MQIVLINQDFSRTVYNVTAVDSQLVTTRGLSLYIRPGITRLVEGNVLRDVSTGNTFINPNAYDGVDNDFDGLIDENSFVHYRQVKRTNTVPPKTLIDVLRPVRYINYATGAGTNPQSMIDEKRTDRFDNDQDWVLGTDDVGRDGIDGTGDGGEGDGVPTSGIDARKSLNEGRSPSPASASRRISRCSASADRPCRAARRLSASTTSSSMLRTIN